MLANVRRSVDNASQTARKHPRFAPSETFGTGCRGIGSEPRAQGVLRRYPRIEELEQVVGSPSLRADPRQAVATEGLATDDGAGRAAVDVDVARPQLRRDPFDVRRRSGDEPSGERVLG